MQTLPLKLAPGSDLRLSLEELAQRDGISGFVLGVVGNLTRASFQCPGQAEPTVLEGDLEVITLNGTFSPEGVHLHLSLSDGACQVWGGHLEPGTIVSLISKSELRCPHLAHGVTDAMTVPCYFPRLTWSMRDARFPPQRPVPSVAGGNPRSERGQCPSRAQRRA